MEDTLRAIHLSIHGREAERALEIQRILIACVCASCGVLGQLVFLMSWRS